MSPDELIAARTSLRLSQEGLSVLLGRGEEGRRQVGRWELGEHPMDGAAARVLDLVLNCPGVRAYLDLPGLRRRYPLLERGETRLRRLRQTSS